ncbi:hypothetical protein [Lysinibacillus piscis]|uniref:Uncharacterized protein n=1 Tax=Lysinibacillus piscis TaxID=2518931 RepID=A0ABQ5NKQ0_9BACI|nr:hypothetical protein [Lysinibacillus sp. KH24]GLC88850.1 hypothetical protein LYSBPC_19770 [Lysinibacillus sp. KH24]
MRLLRLTMVYIAIFLLIIFLKLSLPMSIAICMVVPTISTLHYWYVAYRTNNMRTVERFIKARQKEPIFKAAYLMVHGTEEELLEAFDVIIKKYKRPFIQYNYRFMKAIIQEDLEQAKQAALQIQKEPFASYAHCYIAALEGRTEAMYSEQLTQPWMQPAVEAVYAYTYKDDQRFEQCVQQSVEQARGVQKYTLIHNFAKMKQKLANT